jgi:hypothetical protein
LQIFPIPGGMSIWCQLPIRTCLTKNFGFKYYFENKHSPNSQQTTFRTHPMKALIRHVVVYARALFSNPFIHPSNPLSTPPTTTTSEKHTHTHTHTHSWTRYFLTSCTTTLVSSPPHTPACSVSFAWDGQARPGAFVPVLRF